MFDCYKYKRHINLSLSLVLTLTSCVSHGRQSFEVFLQGVPPPIRPNVHNLPPPSHLCLLVEQRPMRVPREPKLVSSSSPTPIAAAFMGTTKQSDGAAQTLVRVKVWGKRGRVTGPPGVDTQNGAAPLAPLPVLPCGGWIERWPWGARK